SAPTIFQNGPSGKQAVKGGFVQNDDATIGFQITGAYDHTRDLVIDPVINWATYFGSDFDDHGLGIAVDAAGNSFVTGWTTGFDDTTFPITDGSTGGDAQNAFSASF